MEEDEELALTMSDFTTVKGSMCKIFKSDCKPERVFHKQMGVINPIHLYEDPRKDKRHIEIEPKTKSLTLFDFAQKYKEKSFLPTHLTTPFIYIEKLNFKEPNGSVMSYSHPDLWNKSYNINSTRVQTQIPKQELCELTRSIVQSKREKGDNNDYEQTERMKKYVKQFFTTLKNLLSEKRCIQEIATELTDPISKRSKKGRELGLGAKKLQANQAKQMIELDKEYSLREIWKAYCTVKKLIFQKNDQEIIEVNHFSEFIKALGYPEKRWNEIEKYFDYCNKKEEVGLVHPSHSEEERHETSPKKDIKADAVSHIELYDSPLKVKNDHMRNSSLMQWRPTLKKIDRSTFSMRAFIYNFEKFLKEEEKIPYVLSIRAANERSVSLKHYIIHFFKAYSTNKEEINRIRDLEDECKTIIKGIASEYDDQDVKRELAELSRLEESMAKGHRYSKEEKALLQVNVESAKNKVQTVMEKFNELYSNYQNGGMRRKDCVRNDVC